MQTKLYFTFTILSVLAIGAIFAKPAATTPKCPPGVPLVNCIIDPCKVSSCPGDLTAKCISNYCGGCNAEWYTTNGKPAQCIETKCPPDQLEVQCVKDPCQGETCSNYPDAFCVANYCGGCYFDWYLPNGEKVKCDNSS